MPVHPPERLKRKIKIENYDALSKKAKTENVTFIKQLPLHPRERMKRLAKLDDKVHFVKEVASVRPKKLTKTNKKNSQNVKYNRECLANLSWNEY